MVSLNFAEDREVKRAICYKFMFIKLPFTAVVHFLNLNVCGKLLWRALFWVIKNSIIYIQLQINLKLTLSNFQCELITKHELHVFLAPFLKTKLLLQFYFSNSFMYVAYRKKNLCILIVLFSNIILDNVFRHTRWTEFVLLGL